MTAHVNRAALDPATTLCLACSSSLPPRKTIPTAGTPSSATSDEIFITRCCGRPICPACLTTNPRLARYYPCLHCLGGVEAVSSLSRTGAGPPGKSNTGLSDNFRKNIDGGVKDEDVFTIGDDNADDTEDGSESASTDLEAPPAYEDRPSDAHISIDGPNSPEPNFVSQQRPEESDSAESSELSGPPRYYIKPTDTLLGIALKFGVDRHQLCKLNDLPPSTIRTTPHLLHTRSFLILPLTARTASLCSSVPLMEDSQRQERRVRAHAELRFRALTKEDDVHVARAYVAIADSRDPDDDVDFKKLEVTEGEDWKKPARETVAMGSSCALEERALSRYYDDDEWERQERQEGRGISLPKFPQSQGSRSHGCATEKGRKTWWHWRQQCRAIADPS